MNSASLPASAASENCSGSRTVNSRVSPATAPMRLSSKPGGKVPLPSVSGKSLPEPPGSGAPAALPSKVITATSPSRRPRASSTFFTVAWLWRISSSRRSTSSSFTSMLSPATSMPA